MNGKQGAAGNAERCNVDSRLAPKKQDVTSEGQVVMLLLVTSCFLGDTREATLDISAFPAAHGLELIDDEQQHE